MRQQQPMKKGKQQTQRILPSNSYGINFKLPQASFIKSFESPLFLSKHGRSESMRHFYLAVLAIVIFMAGCQTSTSPNAGPSAGSSPGPGSKSGSASPSTSASPTPGTPAPNAPGNSNLPPSTSSSPLPRGIELPNGKNRMSEKTTPSKGTVTNGPSDRNKKPLN
jgi:hypothetical protein